MEQKIANFAIKLEYFMHFLEYSVGNRFILWRIKLFRTEYSVFGIKLFEARRCRLLTGVQKSKIKKRFF